jgi:hypothetical protein
VNSEASVRAVDSYYGCREVYELANSRALEHPSAGIKPVVVAELHP